jgi:hypothetical protein
MIRLVKLLSLLGYFPVIFSNFYLGSSLLFVCGKSR